MLLFIEKHTFIIFIDKLHKTCNNNTCTYVHTFHLSNENSLRSTPSITDAPINFSHLHIYPNYSQPPT